MIQNEKIVKYKSDLLKILESKNKTDIARKMEELWMLLGIANPE